VAVCAACTPSPEAAARKIALRECECYALRRQGQPDSTCRAELETLYAAFQKDYRFAVADSARVKAVQLEVRQALKDCGATP
jgi:hypothetical protein